jgi:hypothetical protein
LGQIVLTKAGAKPEGSTVTKGLVSKGRVVSARGDVDKASVESKPPIAEHRQHRVDTKAFTGRGSLARVMEAQAAVDSVREAMKQLIALSLKVHGRPMYLAVHKRSETGQVSIRWRRVNAKAAHLPWREVDRLIASFPEELRGWYHDVNQHARLLNQREMDARRALARAQRALATQQSDLFRQGGGR